MRSLATLVLLVVSAAAASEVRASDYTGVWKGKCTDGFGLRIERADGELYSVSFCGPGRCAEPGEWTPNTPIEGDPKYVVGASGELQITRNGTGFRTYVRCKGDPGWKAKPAPAAPAEPSQQTCPLGAEAEPGVLIAWITGVRTTTQFGDGQRARTVVQPFRPLALLDGGSLTVTSGAGVHAGQSFWNAADPAAPPLRLRSVDAFLDHMGEDHCVYFGTVEGGEPAAGTLLTSRPLPGLFRAPAAEDRATFARLHPRCVQQGDPLPGEAPPLCVRPELLALTDIDGDGRLEYWSREPYRWDFGLTVWEDGGTLAPLLSVCAGCSD